MKRHSIIMENMDHCLLCGTNQDIHIHEVIYGIGKRKLSIKYGLCVSLCGKHHNLSNEGVHFNRDLDLSLKRLAQRRFAKAYPDLDFVKIFGKNYEC